MKFDLRTAMAALGGGALLLTLAAGASAENTPPKPVGGVAPAKKLVKPKPSASSDVPHEAAKPADAMAPAKK